MHILCMANGTEVPSHGVWTGTFQWNKVKVCTSFKVFNGGGIGNILIGKPLLEQLQARHDYGTDTIIIPASPQLYIIKNIANTPTAPCPKPTVHSPQNIIPQNLNNEPQVHMNDSVFLTVTLPSNPKPHTSISDHISTNKHFIFAVSLHCT
ncbi:hypothetical protein BDR07DRAFT_1295839 [Suillus spraguei]|nr:hypothetical protein BDR07DRAFT_1295839 [Suillus spraguei]